MAHFCTTGCAFKSNYVNSCAPLKRGIVGNFFTLFDSVLLIITTYTYTMYYYLSCVYGCLPKGSTLVCATVGEQGA